MIGSNDTLKKKFFSELRHNRKYVFYIHLWQVLTFTMNAHRNHGLRYAGWYRWLISKAGALASQKECMRACYCIVIYWPPVLSVLSRIRLELSSSSPDTSSLLKIKMGGFFQFLSVLQTIYLRARMTCRRLFCNTRGINEEKLLGELKCT